RGRHRICAKIGADAPLNAVFVGRRPTGETWTPELAERHPDRDWILTRILWLDGCEDGVNRGGEVDSCRRYIYIHGTPDTEPMGDPRSTGCVRMRNVDVVELFEAVDVGTIVDIRETYDVRRKTTLDGLPPHAGHESASELRRVRSHESGRLTFHVFRLTATEIK